MIKSKIKYKENGILFFIYLLFFLIGFAKYENVSIILVVLFSLRIIVKKQKIVFNDIMILLMLFGFSHLMIITEEYNMGNIIREMAVGVLPFCMLQICYMYQEKITIEKVTLAFGSGLLMRFVLAIINAVIEGNLHTQIYLTDPVTRTPLAATLYSTMLYLSLALAFFYLNKKKNKFNVLFIAIVGVTSFVAVFILGRRLVILAAVLCMFYVVMNKIYQNKRKVKRNKVLVWNFVITAILTVLILNFDKMILSLNSSNLLQRFNGNIYESSGRLRRNSFYLSHFFDQVNGGDYFLDHVGYAHNFWLDVYGQAGIFPFLSLVIASILIFVLLFQVHANVNVEKESRLIILIYIVSFLQFFTEPSYYSLKEYVWAFMCIVMVYAFKLKKYRTVKFR